MLSQDELRTSFSAAVGDIGTGVFSADRLCVACVELLQVDGAAISFTYAGSTQGTFGSSGELSRRLDEYQFTFGEGPCLEAVSGELPVLVADLRDPLELRWPAYTGAVLKTGIRAVFALPVSVSTTYVGALDLYRHQPGPLSDEGLAGSLIAAQLAALPLLDLMTADVDWSSAADGESGWHQLASLERVEVYQATGMIMGQLGVGAVEALVRLRAYAYAEGMTASEAAWGIVERRVLWAALDSDSS